MSVSPPGHWLLNRMVFLFNRILEIINTTVEKGIVFLLQNSNTFTGINIFKGGINVDNIDSINGNTTFNSEIIVNSNITANNGSFIGDNLVINTISLEDSTSLPYITVKDDIRFNKDIIVNGDLTINGTSFSVNSQTLTINDRFITLNANLSYLDIPYTDPAGIIIETHNTTEHSRGYLLWTLFDPNNPINRELNRTWDLSGDNLRGNVLKATTLRGSILDSYYSPNISIISDIDMNNNDISNINTLTASDLNIDVIKTNIASNISVMNTIDMNNNYIINANISALNHSQINVENGVINSRNLTLGSFNADPTNGVTFRSWYGLSPLENTKVVLHPNDTLYLPENNGVPFGNNNHTQSIIGISGVYKIQSNTQQLLNSQCYLIPPSMVSNVSDLQGVNLFKTIGEQNENIQFLAGYPDTNISINKLKNTLVPTVGQIVDLLNYLGVTMEPDKADNLKSTYS